MADSEKTELNRRIFTDKTTVSAIQFLALCRGKEKVCVKTKAISLGGLGGYKISRKLLFVILKNINFVIRGRLLL